MCTAHTRCVRLPMARHGGRYRQVYRRLGLVQTALEIARWDERAAPSVARADTAGAGPVIQGAGRPRTITGTLVRQPWIAPGQLRQAIRASSRNIGTCHEGIPHGIRAVGQQLQPHGIRRQIQLDRL